MDTTQTAKRPNYLSRLPEERRKWPRRQTNLVVRVAFTKHGMRQLIGVQATMVNLSEGGAALVSSMLEQIPEHFYIALGKLEIMLPCAQVSIANDVMRVCFAKDQPTAFIDELAAIPFPLAMLSPLKDGGYGRLLRHFEDAAVCYG
jgi:hypothetical protein